MVTPSRGCLQCRRRHLKCDEGRPACLHCLRHGIVCSGPISGILIFNETEKVKKKHVTRQQRPSRPAAPAQDSPRNNTTATAHTDERAAVKDTRVGVGQSDYASLIRLPHPGPTRADIFDQQFVAHLATSFAGWSVDPAFDFDPCWLSEMCEHKSLVSRSSPAVGCASRAVSMAFYSVVSKHTSIAKASYEWYSRALVSQRAFIQAGAVQDLEEISEAIYSCMLMMYYEVMMCTTPYGWADHAAAGVALLESIGPENCQTGRMNLVFRHFRLIAIYLAIHTKVPPALAEPRWCTVPFALEPKLPLDKLVDILLCLPAYQAACDDILLLSGANPRTVRRDDVNNLHSGLEELLQGLHGWYLAYGEDASGSGSSSSSHGGTTSGYIGINQVAASVLSLYHMAVIIAQHLLLSLSPRSQSSASQLEKLASHCDSVLSLGFEDLKRSPADLGCVYLIFPVKMVAIYSPSEQQRRTAVEILLRWARYKVASSDLFNNSIRWVRDTVKSSFPTSSIYGNACVND